jgi:hypothetical protein
MAAVGIIKIMVHAHFPIALNLYSNSDISTSKMFTIPAPYHPPQSGWPSVRPAIAGSKGGTESTRNRAGGNGFRPDPQSSVRSNANPPVHAHSEQALFSLCLPAAICAATAPIKNSRLAA